MQRRSITLKEDLSKGQIITENNIDFLRPFLVNGFRPDESDKVIGMKVERL